MAEALNGSGSDPQRKRRQTEPLLATGVMMPVSMQSAERRSPLSDLSSDISRGRRNSDDPGSRRNSDEIIARGDRRNSDEIITSQGRAHMPHVATPADWQQLTSPPLPSAEPPNWFAAQP